MFIVSQRSRSYRMHQFPCVAIDMQRHPFVGAPTINVPSFLPHCYDRRRLHPFCVCVCNMQLCILLIPFCIFGQFGNFCLMRTKISGKNTSTIVPTQLWHNVDDRLIGHVKSNNFVLFMLLSNLFCCFRLLSFVFRSFICWL
jgi:hypothetical protein